MKYKTSLEKFTDSSRSCVAF